MKPSPMLEDQIIEWRDAAKKMDSDDDGWGSHADGYSAGEMYRRMCALLALISAQPGGEGVRRTPGTIEACPKCRLLDEYPDMPLAQYGATECGRPSCPIRPTSPDPARAEQVLEREGK